MVGLTWLPQKQKSGRPAETCTLLAGNGNQFGTPFSGTEAPQLSLAPVDPEINASAAHCPDQLCHKVAARIAPAKLAFQPESKCNCRVDMSSTHLPDGEKAIAAPIDPNRMPVTSLRVSAEIGDLQRARCDPTSR